MQNYYEILGIGCEASTEAVKRAFREKAKKLHPDIAGKGAEAAMRKLITAYETLSNCERRSEYDRAYSRFMQKAGFDYRSWLRERAFDSEYAQSAAYAARLIFFDLLHLEEDEALEVWQKHGGIQFQLEKYLDREDWMDCAFILAEELDKRGQCYDAFQLLAALIREERKLPYFRHFTEEIEIFIKEIVRLRLRSQVDDETWIGCMETLIGLNFPARDHQRWLHALAKTLRTQGDETAAGQIFHEAEKYGASMKKS
jgi:hypothetical protein